MPTFGTIKSVKPRIEVLRGFNPQEPHTRTHSLPVADGEIIRSGMAVIPVYNAVEDRHEWQLPTSAELSAQTQVYFAYNHSADEDVIEAGTLPALSSTGQFEIETGYFIESDDGVAGTYDAFEVGSRLTVCDETSANAAAGLAAGSLKGYIRLVSSVDADVPVVGRLTRQRGFKSLAGIHSNAQDLNVVSLYTDYSAELAP